MKNFFSLCICLVLVLTTVACGKKDIEPVVDINPVPKTVTGDKSTDKDTENADEAVKNSEDAPSVTEEEEKKTEEAETDPDESMESATNKEIIKNSLRDARELIDEECYDDAAMVVEILKTYDLSESEKKELAEIEKLIKEAE